MKYLAVMVPKQQQRCAFREPGDRQGDRHPRQARKQQDDSLPRLLEGDLLVGHTVVPVRAVVVLDGEHNVQFDLEQVALARLLAHELAAAGDPEALLGTGVRLVLRHFWIPLLGRRADGPGLRTPRGLPVGR